MKFTAALMLTALLVSDSAVEARRGRRKKSQVLHASCKVNLDKETQVEDDPTGGVWLSQKAAEEGADENTVHFGTFWWNLATEEAHTLAIIDDDSADCGGSALTDFTLDADFTTNTDGKGGKKKGSSDAFSISPDSADTIIGKYIQLSDSNSAQIGCCQVAVSEGKKKRKGRKGGKKRKLEIDAEFLQF